jgi:hypothetical protein
MCGPLNLKEHNIYFLQKPLVHGVGANLYVKTSLSCSNFMVKLFYSRVGKAKLMNQSKNEP